ncbi:DUF2442 domain-containing protein [Pseudomonas batumici]|uniref:DUF2442 domain-containing protein n=1 Tax=Pseudomonas batumici TaxID=226910 RepID=UPI0030CA6604
MANNLGTGASTTPSGSGTQQLRMLGLYAVKAHFDRLSRRLIIDFHSGVRLEVPTGLVETLDVGSATQLSEIEISPSGLGLYFPQLDADILIAGLLQGVMGSPAWMVNHNDRIIRIKKDEAIRIADEKKKTRNLMSEKPLQRVAYGSKFWRIKLGFAGTIRKQDGDGALKVAARRPGSSPKGQKKR